MTTLLLKDIPKEVSDLIIDVQHERRKDKKEPASRNQSQTVIYILKEYKKIKDIK